MIAKDIVVPALTDCGSSGLMLPPIFACGVTVQMLGVNVAVTEQCAVIAPVVYTLPDNVPPQPLTEAM